MTSQRVVSWSHKKSEWQAEQQLLGNLRGWGESFFLFFFKKNKNKKTLFVFLNMLPKHSHFYTLSNVLNSQRASVYTHACTHTQTWLNTASSACHCCFYIEFYVSVLNLLLLLYWFFFIIAVHLVFSGDTPVIYTLSCTACLCVFSCLFCEFFLSLHKHTWSTRQSELNENHILNPFNVTNCTKDHSHFSSVLHMNIFVVWQENILYIAWFCIAMLFSWCAKRGIKTWKQHLPWAADCKIFNNRHN